MFFKRLLTICFLALFLKFVFTSSAHAAYLDPGSGSFILQIVIASLMGFLFLVKIYWKKIRTFFGSVFSGDVNEKD